ncbi:MAG TPA: cupin domain-containing protein [Roseimicrobium sp.]|nr:cupin domain-containing protein [Roseimicrobium sp.]
MTQPLPPVRRIVTAVDESGMSYIAEDGESPAVLTVAGRPGYRNSNLWQTRGGSSVDAADNIAAHAGVCPPSGGTVLRVIDIPPRPADPAEFRRQAEATFKGMFPDADHRNNPDQPVGMHVTPTVDYAILLSGELVAIMDREETLMRAGDVLIQRGTSHAWENRSSMTARIAFILVDALPQQK